MFVFALKICILFLHSLASTGLENTNLSPHTSPTRLPILSLRGGAECHEREGAREDDCEDTRIFVTLAHFLPKKKLRMVEPLARALENIGIHATIRPLDLFQTPLSATNTTTTSSCDVLISHVKHLLGEEHCSADARDSLKALELWEKDNPHVVILDPLSAQRFLTSRHRIARALENAVVEGSEQDGDEEQVGQQEQERKEQQEEQEVISLSRNMHATYEEVWMQK